MSLRLVFKALAYHDLAQAYEWYESKRPNLGAEMAAALLEKVRDVQQRPTFFPVKVEPDVRRVLVDRFPYIVYFRIRQARVVILGILHAARDMPRVLRDRLS